MRIERIVRARYNLVMSTGRRVFRARHVATMLSPLMEDGCVVTEGDRIVDVRPFLQLKPSQIDVEIDGILLPGLINAHTHLELTNVPRPASPGAFQAWLMQMMASMRKPGPVEFAADRAAAVREGIAQCLRFGVTCIGDISQNVGIVRPILRDGPIRSVSFGECLGLGSRRQRFDTLLAKAAAVDLASPLMEIGISPHAPYTVDADGYRSAAGFQHAGRKLTTHYMETPDEAPFVATRSGPFAEMYQRLGFDPGSPDDGGAGMVEWLLRRGVRMDRWLLAHMNYCQAEDLHRLHAAGEARVVWCPRTHAYFGHPPHPWKQMRQRDVIVCVGTDSCASSPDLNIVDDLRLLHAQGEQDTERLWSLVTREAWRALQWGCDRSQPAKPLGVLAPRAMADLVAFHTRSDKPLREILESPGLVPSNVWIGGEHHVP